MTCKIKDLPVDVLVNFVGGDITKRSYVEGKRLYEANHLIICGVTKSDATNMHLKGKCLQTSNVKGEPHTIDMRLTVEEDEKKITVKGICSCKAGKAEKCKHIVCMLYHLTK